MASSVTLKDVARNAEVSIVTASRVLNNHSNVTQETRQRVLKAASALGYFEQNKANFLAAKSETGLKQIGFLLYGDPGSNNDPFWSQLLHAAEDEADKHNIRLMFLSVGRLLTEPQRLLSTIKDMNLSGLLLVGPTPPEVIKIIHATGLPLVLLDNHTPELPVDSVLSDNFGGAKAAVEHLISQGHRRIAMIGALLKEGSLNRATPVSANYCMELRAQGYRQALFEAGLPFEPELFVPTNYTPEGSYGACKSLLDGKQKFSAIFCSNDTAAAWTIKALNDHNLRVPEDISVVGFDDIDLASQIIPSLTTVRVNKEAMSALAVKALIARVNDPKAEVVSSIVRVTLIKRDSVVSVPNA